MTTIASKTGEVKFLKEGEPGKPGALVFPAGFYSESDEYVKTELSTPMVLCDNEYYVLNINGSIKGLNPKDDYTANGSNAHWIRMAKIKYAFFEVIMANFAKLASAVFSGDYMFSQHGFNQLMEITNAYKNFTPEMDKFTPMILFNMLNGTGHLAGNNIFWNEYGSVFYRSPLIEVWRHMYDEAKDLPNGGTYKLNPYKGTFIDASTSIGWILNLEVPKASDFKNGIFEFKYQKITRSGTTHHITCSEGFPVIQNKEKKKYRGFNYMGDADEIKIVLTSSLDVTTSQEDVYIWKIKSDVELEYFDEMV